MSAKTNKTILSFAVEQSIGVLPGTPSFTEIEWNDLTTFGATISSVTRDPINQDRMQKKGAISDLDSAVEFQTDLTLSSFNNFAQGFFYRAWEAQTTAVPTSVAAAGYSHAAVSGALSAGTLIYARNLGLAANNGLKVVDSGSTTILTPVVSTTVTETSPPTGSRFDVVGVQGGAGDIELDSSGNLVSTTLDFTTLGIQVGQSIYIGGGTAPTTFATAAYTGLARVRIVTDHLITLDKRDWTVGTADDGATKTIQIFIGDFISNVAQNDGDFLEETYTFEGQYSTLEAGNATVYEYPNGCKPNDMVLDFPLSDKAGVTFGFVNLDTPVPTASQASGNRLNTYETDALGTTSDCVRLSLMDSALSDYTTNFKNLSITVANGVNPEKVLCSLGAVDMNIGKFIVTGTAQVLFTDESMISAVRNYETTSLDFAINNDDGCLHFDIPEMTFSSANKSFPVDESVLMDIEIQTQKSDFFGYVMSTTRYNYLPV